MWWFAWLFPILSYSHKSVESLSSWKIWKNSSLEISANLASVTKVVNDRAKTWTQAWFQSHGFP